MRVPLVERQAFARARRYLRYSPIALWLAHASAFASGIFYVALLILLGLFADLVISRGQIPSFHDLPQQDQANLAASAGSLKSATIFLANRHVAYRCPTN